MSHVHPRFIVVLGILGLVLASGAAMADRACFTWTAVGNGTINFDGSGSSPGPGERIYWWVWNFGDGNGGGPSGNPTISHTYAAPPPYDSTVGLYVTFLPYYNTVSVSCDTWPYLPPVGPQPPSSGTCCSP